MKEASKGSNVYLHFARGYFNDHNITTGTTFPYSVLVELSEDRVVFYSSGIGFWREYNEDLVFERLSEISTYYWLY